MHRNAFLVVAAVALATVVVPAVALAADPATPTKFFPIVNCGGTNYDNSQQDPCTPCGMFQVGYNVINLVLFGITGPIAVFMIVLAGGMFLLGAGNPAMLNRARKLLTDTLLGVTIILLSWVTVTFLIKSIAGAGQSGKWYEFSCPAFLGQIQQKPSALPLVINMPKYTPVAYPSTVSNKTGGGAGREIPLAAIPGARVNLCEARSDNGCAPKPDNPCPEYRDAIDRQAYGAATPQLLGAIMWHESNCKYNARGRTNDFGLMQMRVPTANQFRKGCVRPDPKTSELYTGLLDVSWLLDKKHAEESVCIAAHVLNANVKSCGPDPGNVVAGYNGGEKACKPSRDCQNDKSCMGGAMRAYECPYDNAARTASNKGYNITREYVSYIRQCLR